jgi:hypothetical protein
LQQRGRSAALFSFFRPRFRPTENRRSLSTGAVTVFPAATEAAGTKQKTA